MAQDTTYKELPPEEDKAVEALWAQLHQEALTHYDELAPQVSRRFAVVGVLAGICLLLAGLWSANQYYFQPREDARQGTATAQSIAAATHIAQISTAEAVAFSGESQATQTAQAANANATATANAGSANATATANASSANAMATANAASANATATAQAVIAEENRCRDASFYSFEVPSEPTLWPEIGYQYVTDKLWPQVRATWVVTLSSIITPTDTQWCAWNSVALKTLSGEAVADGMVELQRDGALVETVQPGESVELLLSFPRLQALDSGEWVLVVNGVSLFDQPHLKLDIGDDVWVNIVAPTPIPVPPTPTPTATPTCRTEEYECNCRDETDPVMLQTKRVCDTCTRTVCE